MNQSKTIADKAAREVLWYINRRYGDKALYDTTWIEPIAAIFSKYDKCALAEIDSLEAENNRLRESITEFRRSYRPR